jgi:glycine/serine hydroxymethyltransferase
MGRGTWKTILSSMFFLVAVSSLVLWAAPPASAQQRYYVCLQNTTENELHYATMWCNQNAANCTEWQNYSVAPYNTMKHWSSPGNEIMHINIHTGGPDGYYQRYSFFGSVYQCEDWTTKDLIYDNNGVLGIFDSY